MKFGKFEIDSATLITLAVIIFFMLLASCGSAIGEP